MIVYANRVLPDGLQPEHELRNKSLFQTTNFKLNFVPYECLPSLFDSTHHGTKITRIHTHVDVAG